MRTWWRGNANAWECDEMGHLNVRFYVAKATEALDGLLGAIGAPSLTVGPMTLSVSRVHVRFLAEARAGAALRIDAAVVKPGPEDAPDQIKLLFEMRDALSNAQAASFVMYAVGAGADLDAIRALAAPVDLPPTAGPFGLPPALPEPSPGAAPTLSQALARGGVEIGRGVFSPEESVPDRLTAGVTQSVVRLDAYIGRISDSAATLFRAVLAPTADEPGDPASAPPDPIDWGTVMLESRLDVVEPARAGDRFVVVSRFTSHAGKTMRITHLICNAATEQPIAVISGVGAFFNLTTRRAAALTGPALARLEQSLAPDLAL